jgi:protein tyrosine/serine phosphatase
MRTAPRKRVISAALVLVVAAGAVGGGVAWSQARLPKRFAEVVPGKLYRSGEVSASQLAVAHKEHGVRRVISLLDASAAETIAERDAAQRLGLEWYNIPMGGSGQSTPEARRRVLELLADPDAPPTLVHCGAGTNRTGLAIGLYRIHCQGWSLDATLEEMRQYGFRDLAKHEELRAALRAAASQPSSQPVFR